MGARLITLPQTDAVWTGRVDAACLVALMWNRLDADLLEPYVADDKPLRVGTRAAGVFLFVPLLARMGFDSLVRQAGYPGSKVIPADAALLSLLALKLLRKERLSHIDDYNVDEGLGLSPAHPTAGSRRCSTRTSASGGMSGFITSSAVF